MNTHSGGRGDLTSADLDRRHFAVRAKRSAMERARSASSQSSGRSDKVYPAVGAIDGSILRSISSCRRRDDRTVGVRLRMVRRPVWVRIGR